MITKFKSAICYNSEQDVKGAHLPGRIKINAADATFFKHNAVYWGASLGVAFLNYLYYPIIGHLLNPTNFGEVQTIFSILTQTAIFLQVLSLVSIGIITKYNDHQQREALSNELSRLALLLSSVVLLMSVVFSASLEKFFHFNSVAPFLVLAMAILITVPGSFANAYLQGHKKFGSLSAIQFIGALAKIGFSVLFVLLGFKTLGALGGLIVAQIIGLLLALRRGRGVRHFIATNLQLRKPQLQLIKPEAPFAVMVLVTSLTTNLLLSFDILVIKHYFPPAEAGLYTGISIISNIIYYLTGPLASVLVPSLKPYGAMKTNYRLLNRSLLLTAIIGGSATLIFIGFPHLIVSILLGHRYTPYAPYLRGLSLALFGLSLSNILIYFHIGLRHYWVAPVVLIGLITTVVLLTQMHATIGAVVRDLVIGSGVLFTLLVGLSAKYRLGVITA